MQPASSAGAVGRLQRSFAAKIAAQDDNALGGG